MSKSFRTRKRGTPRQIGKKFPVLEKKKLPPRIMGPSHPYEIGDKKHKASYGLRYRPVGGVLPKLVLQFSDQEDLASFMTWMDSKGIPEDIMLAPEDLEYDTKSNRAIFKYGNKGMALQTLKDVRKAGFKFNRKTARIVY